MRAAASVSRPSQASAGDESGVLKQPPAGVGVRVALDEHCRVLAGLFARRADWLGGARDVADLALGVHAGAERRRHLVPAPHDHDGVRGQPGGIGEGGVHLPRGLGAGGEFGQQALVKADVIEHGPGPGAGPGVEQGQRRRVREVHRQHPGCLAEDVRSRRHDVGGPREDLRFLLPDPDRLEHGMG